uniref:hypothetical protein n=1 Tax=Cyanobium sp. TaxID=2164130 RepID=UPI004048E2BC
MKTLWALLLAIALLLGAVQPSAASPGLCVGLVCADEIQRSEQLPWQLKLRVSDQRGQHERLLVDCRDGVLSPREGLIDRGYAAAVSKRACRIAVGS